MFEGVVLGIIIATVAGLIKSAIEKYWLLKKIECWISIDEKVVSYNATVIVGKNGDISWIDNKDDIPTL